MTSKLAFSGLLILALVVSGCWNFQTRPGPSSYMCETCSQMARISDIGQCSRCRGQTSSSSLQLCNTCGLEARQCVGCLNPIP